MAGIDKSSRLGRFKESIEIVRRIWREEKVTYKGEYYELRDIETSLRPLQANGCPIWIAAVVDPAIRRAARIGDVWLTTFYPSCATLARQLDIYRTTRREAGLPAPTDSPVLRECYVGASSSSALEDCAQSLQYKYAAYHSWGQDKILPPEDRFDQPFEDFRKNRFIIGDTRQVRDELQRYRDELGVDHLIMRMQWPGLDQDKVLQSIDRLGDAIGGVR